MLDVFSFLKNKQKGGAPSIFSGLSLSIKIIIIIVLSVLIVPALMYAFPIVKYAMIAIIVFFIYEIVAKAFGNTILTFLVTGLICYFLVFKYLFLTSGLVVFYFFLGAGIMSVFVWGTSRFSKK